MSEADTRAREALAELHDPLARIELAASQLARSGAPPGTHALAERILDAVRDLDGRLQDSIAALEPLRADPHVRDDCREEIAEAVTKMQPILAARGITLVEPELPERRIGGDGRFARRATLQLLRAGGRWARSGDELTIALRETRSAYGIELNCRGTEAPPTGTFDDAARFARSSGAELAMRGEPNAAGRPAATLWRRRGAPAP